MVVILRAADGPNAMWTGYTTSRAALKGYVRDTSNVFTAARQLQAFTGEWSEACVSTDRSTPLAS